jgi:hypothetical protein
MLALSRRSRTAVLSVVSGRVGSFGRRFSCSPIRSKFVHGGLSSKKEDHRKHRTAVGARAPYEVGIVTRGRVLRSALDIAGKGIANPTTSMVSSER